MCAYLCNSIVNFRNFPGFFRRLLCSVMSCSFGIRLRASQKNGFIISKTAADGAAVFWRFLACCLVGTFHPPPFRAHSPDSRQFALRCCAANAGRNWHRVSGTPSQNAIYQMNASRRNFRQITPWRHTPRRLRDRLRGRRAWALALVERFQGKFLRPQIMNTHSPPLAGPRCSSIDASLSISR